MFVELLERSALAVGQVVPQFLPPGVADVTHAAAAVVVEPQLSLSVAPVEWLVLSDPLSRWRDTSSAIPARQQRTRRHTKPNSICRRPSMKQWDVFEFQG